MVTVPRTASPLLHGFPESRGVVLLQGFVKGMKIIRVYLVHSLSPQLAGHFLHSLPALEYLTGLWSAITNPEM